MVMVEITVNITEVTNNKEYLLIHTPFQSSLRIVVDEPDELGLNDTKPTNANVEVVIKPSAVSKDAAFSLL